MANRSAFREMAPAEKEALLARINTVVDAFTSRAEAAHTAELSTDQLRNITLGKSAPSAPALARLCAARSFSLDWVMWGEGEPEVSLRPWVEAMGAPPGLTSEEVLDLRRLIFKQLALVYAGTPWALDPMADADDMLVRDIIDQIDDLPEEMRNKAVGLVVSGHRAALSRVGKPEVPLGTLNDSHRPRKKKRSS